MFTSITIVVHYIRITTERTITVVGGTTFQHDTMLLHPFIFTEGWFVNKHFPHNFNSIEQNWFKFAKKVFIPKANFGENKWVREHCIMLERSTTYHCGSTLSRDTDVVKHSRYTGIQI